VAESAAMLYNLVYLLVVVLLARLRWAVDESCETARCVGVLARADFRAVVWWNFVSCGVVTAGAFLFWMYALYLYAFRVTEHRPESLWAIALLLPVVALCNNPALHPDRVEVLPAVGAAATTWLSIARYGTVAYAIAGVTLYMILKFGSLERSADLSESYGAAFYVVRVVPMGLLFAAFFATGIMRRVELSPQPFVPLISLARNGNFGVSFPSGTIVATTIVGLLQVFFLISFILRYVVVSRRVARMNYRQSRLKVINIFFLFQHTIVPLSVCMLATAMAAAVWPTPLTRIGRVNVRFAEAYVLDVPYYARSGIVLVYTTWSVLECFCSMPSTYKPTFLERVLIQRMGLQAGAAFAPADEADPDDPPSYRARNFGVAPPKPAAKATTILGGAQGAEGLGSGLAMKESEGHVVWEASKSQSGAERALKFRFNEVVQAYNFSWLAYMPDEVVHTSLRDNARSFVLRKIWRESTYDQCVLMATSADEIVIAFRGSVSAVNMKVNLSMSLTRHPPEHDPEWLQGLWRAPTWGPKTPSFHRGFANAYGSLSGNLLDELRRELACIPGRRVVCCGHSLGGALATLAAFDCRLLLDLPDELVTCITFGSPRVGNGAFVRRFAVAVSDSWRILNLHDFVSNYPKRRLQRYEHIPRCALTTLDGNLILDPRFADLKLMHGSSLRAHSLSTYKDALQSFVDVALSAEAACHFEPDWWDFTKYADGVTGENDGIGYSNVDQETKEEVDDFEGLQPLSRVAATSLPSDPVASDLGQSGSLKRLRSLGAPVRPMTKLQLQKCDFKILEGTADMLLGFPSPRAQRPPTTNPNIAQGVKNLI
jgi:pimeloyl-ACP methyl ester carboxylesterase